MVGVSRNLGPPQKGVVSASAAETAASERRHSACRALGVCGLGLSVQSSGCDLFLGAGNISICKVTCCPGGTLPDSIAVLITRK